MYHVKTNYSRNKMQNKHFCGFQILKDNFLSINLLRITKVHVFVVCIFYSHHFQI